MQYWLFKSEPDVFGWDDLVARGEAGEEWDGVRNYQARNNMREMKKGDRGLFYHSNVGKEAVGIVEIVAEAHPDSTTDDARWECVDVKAVERLPRPVPLARQPNARAGRVHRASHGGLPVTPVGAARRDQRPELARG